MTDTTTRSAGLWQMLTDHRRAIEDDVQSRLRQGRSDRSQDVGDDIEHSDAGIQEGLTFSLLQMRTEMLAQIDQALLRLEAGKYGCCFECEEEIAERRLRALPFAVRCQGCEQRREQAQADAKRLAFQRTGVVFTAPSA